MDGVVVRGVREEASDVAGDFAAASEDESVGLGGHCDSVETCRGRFVFVNE